MATAIDEDRLSETFAALANSTRRAILARLAEGAATVNELAEPFELTLPAISKHIKVLERPGWSCGDNGPSTDRARSTPRRSSEVSTLGRAVPARVGGPLRPDGRLPRAAPDRDEEGDDDDD